MKVVLTIEGESIASQQGGLRVVLDVQNYGDNEDECFVVKYEGRPYGIYRVLREHIFPVLVGDHNLGRVKAAELINKGLSCCGLAEMPVIGAGALIC